MGIRIGELAEKSGMSTYAIRFYEKEGLLGDEHITRQSNNYRLYSDTALERLKLIKQGQAAGFTLSELCYIIAAWESGALSTQEQTAIVEQKLLEIEARLRDLERMRQYLLAKSLH